MSFRVVAGATVAFGAAVLACSAGEHAAAPRQPPAGRLVLVVEQPTHRTLLDVRATATYCERDSTVAVVATGGGWVSAVALRTRWPLADSAWFIVQRLVGSAGTAALALRPVGDSVGRALMSGGGRLALSPGAAISGRIETLLSGSGDSVRVSGRLENVAVAEACPSSQ